MSEFNDRIRRELGIDLVNAERKEGSRHPASLIQAVESDVALDVGNLYFTSLDEVLAWCDAESGKPD